MIYSYLILAIVCFSTSQTQLMPQGTIIQEIQLPSLILGQNQTINLELSQYFAGFNLSFKGHDIPNKLEQGRMTPLPTKNKIISQQLFIPYQTNQEEGAFLILDASEILYISVINLSNKEFIQHESFNFFEPINVECFGAVLLQFEIIVDCINLNNESNFLYFYNNENNENISIYHTLSLNAQRHLEVFDFGNSELLLWSPSSKTSNWAIYIFDVQHGEVNNLETISTATNQEFSSIQTLSRVISINGEIYIGNDTNIIILLLEQVLNYWIYNISSYPLQDIGIGSYSRGQLVTGLDQFGASIFKYDTFLKGLSLYRYPFSTPGTAVSTCVTKDYLVFLQNLEEGAVIQINQINNNMEVYYLANFTQGSQGNLYSLGGNSFLFLNQETFVEFNINDQQLIVNSENCEYFLNLIVQSSPNTETFSIPCKISQGSDILVIGNLSNELWIQMNQTVRLNMLGLLNGPCLNYSMQSESYSFSLNSNFEQLEIQDMNILAQKGIFFSLQTSNKELRIFYQNDERDYFSEYDCYISGRQLLCSSPILHYFGSGNQEIKQIFVNSEYFEFYIAKVGKNLELFTLDKDNINSTQQFEENCDCYYQNPEDILTNLGFCWGKQFEYEIQLRKPNQIYQAIPSTGSVPNSALISPEFPYQLFTLSNGSLFIYDLFSGGQPNFFILNSTFPGGCEPIDIFLNPTSVIAICQNSESIQEFLYSNFEISFLREYDFFGAKILFHQGLYSYSETSFMLYMTGSFSNQNYVFAINTTAQGNAVIQQMIPIQPFKFQNLEVVSYNASCDLLIIISDIAQYAYTVGYGSFINITTTESSLNNDALYFDSEVQINLWNSLNGEKMEFNSTLQNINSQRNPILINSESFNLVLESSGINIEMTQSQMRGPIFNFSVVLQNSSDSSSFDFSDRVSNIGQYSLPGLRAFDMNQEYVAMILQNFIYINNLTNVFNERGQRFLINYQGISKNQECFNIVVGSQSAVAYCQSNDEDFYYTVINIQSSENCTVKANSLTGSTGFLAIQNFIIIRQQSNILPFSIFNITNNEECFVEIAAPTYQSLNITMNSELVDFDAISNPDTSVTIILLFGENGPINIVWNPTTNSFITPINNFELSGLQANSPPPERFDQISALSINQNQQGYVITLGLASSYPSSFIINEYVDQNFNAISYNVTRTLMMYYPYNLLFAAFTNQYSAFTTLSGFNNEEYVFIYDQSQNEELIDTFRRIPIIYGQLENCFLIQDLNSNSTLYTVEYDITQATSYLYGYSLGNLMELTSNSSTLNSHYITITLANDFYENIINAEVMNYVPPPSYIWLVILIITLIGLCGSYLYHRKEKKKLAKQQLLTRLIDDSGSDVHTSYVSSGNVSYTRIEDI